MINAQLEHSPLISSQRYINPAVVLRKANNFKVFVVRTLHIKLRENYYQALLDGHHNLAAARLLGIEPLWKGAPAKFERVMKKMKVDQFAEFLINNLTDSDWYYVDTGETVAELLALQV